ncbi:hypothetical protein [Streptomyces sp. NPDC056045]
MPAATGLLSIAAVLVLALTHNDEAAASVAPIGLAATTGAQMRTNSRQ